MVQPHCNSMVLVRDNLDGELVSRHGDDCRGDCRAQGFFELIVASIREGFWCRFGHAPGAAHHGIGIIVPFGPLRNWANLRFVVSQRMWSHLACPWRWLCCTTMALG